MNEAKSTSRRLNLDRRMMGILALFTVLGVCLLIIIVVISQTMSALRAYSTLQTNWTERRKEATFLLTEYLNNPRENIYVSFEESLTLIDNATKVRAELFKEETNRDTVREYLLTAYIRPYDIDGMITTFERFHSFPDFAKAIQAWKTSDSLVNDVRSIAELARDVAREMPAEFADQRLSWIRQVKALDNRLTEVQYQLAASLADGNHFLAKVILLISISIGVILLVIGSALTIRFMKNVREWGRVIEISEQRYKSLYERNPNAVFSMDKKGQIMDVNEAMTKTVGYGHEELFNMSAEQLVIPEQRDHIKKLFDKVVLSEPQSFETKWVRSTGQAMPVYLTYLPIYVDKEIVGVFGIADDISYIKHVEEQLKQQLEEKTLLLAEVHDRVKNNLALISSLLQLQEQVTENENTQRELESTKARIHSIAMVHERLYHVESFSNIRMDEYVRELTNSVKKQFCLKNQFLEVMVEAEPITLDVKRAIPCGLLLNELIVNAFKFALNEDGDKLWIRLCRIDDEVHITIKDNGRGIGPDFKIDEQESLGMVLIRTLTRQLNGTLDIKGDNGTEVNLRFRSEKKVLQSA